jgi:hypothetical protein
MWKSLTILAILLAGTGATFRYFSTENAKLETALLERSGKNLSAVKTHLGEIVKLRQETESTSVSTNEEAVVVNGNLDTANDDKRQKESKKSLLEGQITEKKAKLSNLEEQLKEIGDIEAAVVKSDSLQLEMTTVQQELLSAKESFKNLVLTRKNTEKHITDLRHKETMQLTGQMLTINARIAQSYGQWNFVVINAGGRQGVNADTKLDVRRGRKLIGKLKVSNIESNQSVCDVLSVSAGERIAAGDRVTISKESKWDPNKKKVAAPAAAEGGAPAAEAPAAPIVPPANNDDPFGLDPSPAPANDDPFGLGGGGAAPAAPAAPVEEADPFGL